MILYKNCFCFLDLMLLSAAGISQVNPSFEPNSSVFGVNLPNAVEARNIHYDEIDIQKQRFHLFLPDTNQSYPLVVYILGGGFTGGSTDKVFKESESLKDDVRYCLEKGVAYASIGYRLINNVETEAPDTVGFIKCLNDSKRAIQFIHYRAAELNIIPEKIAVYETSAGSDTSLWIATQLDIADETLSDSVSQLSTLVYAAVGRR
jgi:acetyl esterase/lipase